MRGGRRQPVGGQQRPGQPADRRPVRDGRDLDHEPGAEPAGHRQQLLRDLRAAQRDRREHQHLLREHRRGGYPQRATVNPGSVQSIGSITLDLPPSTAWTTRTETLSVLGSTDDSTFTQIMASAGYTFNPATDNTVTISQPSGTGAQYVELDFTGNTGWNGAQLSEFQIYAP
jgi:hypothetical protein